MDTLAEIEWEDCSLEPHTDPELEGWVRHYLGYLPPPTRYFSRCPWIMRAFVRFDENQLPLQHVDIDTVRFVGLVVSQDNSCRYCYATSRGMLKVLGVPESVIGNLERDLLATSDAQLRLDLTFARSVSRANPIPVDEYRRRIEAGRSPDRMRELAFVAATYTFYNRLTTMPALPLGDVEGVFEKGWMRLLRPLVAWQIRRPARHRVEDRPLGEASGPYSYLPAAFGELPIARPLAAVLDEAWRSTALDRRSRALCFAVIARGLGAQAAEREARTLLVESGMRDDDVDSALANLAAPGMSDVEMALARFARDTIRYQPKMVQRSARAVRSRLDADQFRDVIGLTALANAVCRLEVVLP